MSKNDISSEVKFRRNVEKTDAENSKWSEYSANTIYFTTTGDIIMGGNAYGAKEISNFEHKGLWKDTVDYVKNNMVYYEDATYMCIKDTPARSTGGSTIKPSESSEYWVALLKNVGNYVEINYNDLKTAATKSQLTPGRYYRITDYNTSYKTSFTTSSTYPLFDCANNQFDVVVLALSESTLSPDAYACKHAGTTYFDNCDLGKWRLKYSINNDVNLSGLKIEYPYSSYNYLIVEEEVLTPNGTGIIYQMIDEYGNDLPYDFKNVRFYLTDWKSENLARICKVTPNDFMSDKYSTAGNVLLSSMLKSLYDDDYTGCNRYSSLGNKIIGSYGFNDSSWLMPSDYISYDHLYIKNKEIDKYYVIKNSSTKWPSVNHRVLSVPGSSDMYVYNSSHNESYKEGPFYTFSTPEDTPADATTLGYPYILNNVFKQGTKCGQNVFINLGYIQNNVFEGDAINNLFITSFDNNKFHSTLQDCSFLTDHASSILNCEFDNLRNSILTDGQKNNRYLGENYNLFIAPAIDEPTNITFANNTFVNCHDIIGQPKNMSGCNLTGCSYIRLYSAKDCTIEPGSHHINLGYYFDQQDVMESTGSSIYSIGKQTILKTDELGTSIIHPIAIGAGVCNLSITHGVASGSNSQSYAPRALIVSGGVQGQNIMGWDTINNYYKVAPENYTATKYQPMIYTITQPQLIHEDKIDSPYPWQTSGTFNMWGYSAKVSNTTEAAVTWLTGIKTCVDIYSDWARQTPSDIQIEDKTGTLPIGYTSYPVHIESAVAVRYLTIDLTNCSVSSHESSGALTNANDNVYYFYLFNMEDNISDYGVGKSLIPLALSSATYTTKDIHGVPVSQGSNKLVYQIPVRTELNLILYIPVNCTSAIINSKGSIAYEVTVKTPF